MFRLAKYNEQSKKTTIPDVDVFVAGCKRSRACLDFSGCGLFESIIAWSLLKSMSCSRFGFNGLATFCLSLLISCSCRRNFCFKSFSSWRRARMSSAKASFFSSFAEIPSATKLTQQRNSVHFI